MPAANRYFCLPSPPPVGALRNGSELLSVFSVGGELRLRSPERHKPTLVHRNVAGKDIGTKISSVRAELKLRWMVCRNRKDRRFYVQFSVPVPRTVWAVLSMPLLTVSCSFTGALAVTVTLPAVLQLARPASSMLATAVLELLQLRP